MKKAKVKTRTAARRQNFCSQCRERLPDTGRLILEGSDGEVFAVLHEDCFEDWKKSPEQPSAVETLRQKVIGRLVSIEMAKAEADEWNSILPAGTGLAFKFQQVKLILELTHALLLEFKEGLDRIT